MRKYIREMLRYSAKKGGFKASEWVHKQFEQLQIKKYGPKQREINKAKSTHLRRTWKNRINVGKLI